MDTEQTENDQQLGRGQIHGHPFVEEDGQWSVIDSLRGPVRIETWEAYRSPVAGEERHELRLEGHPAPIILPPEVAHSPNALTRAFAAAGILPSLPSGQGRDEQYREDIARFYAAAQPVDLPDPLIETISNCLGEPEGTAGDSWLARAQEARRGWHRWDGVVYISRKLLLELHDRAEPYDHIARRMKELGWDEAKVATETGRPFSAFLAPQQDLIDAGIISPDPERGVT